MVDANTESRFSKLQREINRPSLGELKDKQVIYCAIEEVADNYGKYCKIPKGVFSYMKDILPWKQL